MEGQRTGEEEGYSDRSSGSGGIVTGGLSTTTVSRSDYSAGGGLEGFARSPLAGEGEEGGGGGEGNSSGDGDGGSGGGSGDNSSGEEEEGVEMRVLLR